MTSELSGSCSCQAVRYRIRSAIAMVVNCHCSVCRKAGGAAFSTMAVVKENRMEFLCGEEDLSTYAMGEAVTKYFCSLCGSPIFNRNEKYPGRRMVALGSLDHPERVTPSVNVFCGDRLRWVAVDQEMNNYEQGYR